MNLDVTCILLLLNILKRRYRRYFLVQDLCLVQGRPGMLRSLVPCLEEGEKLNTQPKMKQAHSVLPGLYRNAGVKPVLNWANCLFAEHTSDTSTNYDSFLNWTFSSPDMIRTLRRTLLRSQLACNEMQASARTCGRRAADSMIENVG